MSRLFKFGAAKLLLATVALSGCGGDSGPELAEVTGKVTLDGQPLSKVSLLFTPEQTGGSPSYGATDAEGTYKLLFSTDRSGAMPGKHRVEIVPVEPETDDSGKLAEGAVVVTIPAKYSQPGSLTADVQAGSNSIDFALDTK